MTSDTQPGYLGVVGDGERDAETDDCGEGEREAVCVDDRGSGSEGTSTSTIIDGRSGSGTTSLSLHARTLAASIRPPGANSPTRGDGCGEVSI